MANEYLGARQPGYRSLNTLYRAMFRSEKMHPVLLVTANFKTETLRLWSGYDSLSYGGETYVGAGELLGISPIQENSELKANGMVVSLSGISSTIISLALSENLNSRTITVQFAFLPGDADFILKYKINLGMPTTAGVNKLAVEDNVGGTVIVKEGQTYRFDMSDHALFDHELRVSTTADGTHGGGSQYSTGWSTVGTPGSAGAYSQWVVPSGLAASNPTMYYYDTAASGSGGSISVVTDYILPTPYTVFHGIMDRMDIQDNGETCNVSLSCESYLVRLNHANIRRYTPEDQKAQFPDDEGFEFVAALQDKRMGWGSLSAE